jgi:hypothetical protein
METTTTLSATLSRSADAVRFSRFQITLGPINNASSGSQPAAVLAPMDVLLGLGLLGDEPFMVGDSVSLSWWSPMRGFLNDVMLSLKPITASERLWCAVINPVCVCVCVCVLCVCERKRTKEINVNKQRAM